MPVQKKAAPAPKGPGGGTPKATPLAKAPAPKATPAPAAAKKRGLTHTLELLQTFLSFGIEVPNSTAEIPAAIEQVRPVHGLGPPLMSVF